MAATSGEWLVGSELLLETERRQSLATRARLEVWKRLPLWFFFFWGVLLLNCALTNFTPSKLETAWTCIFPLAWFVGLSVWQGRRDGSKARIWVPVALAVAVPVATMLYHQPSPVQGKTLLAAYELSNFLWAGLLIAHAWRFGRGHVALFFGAALLYGAALENGGIILGFFHEVQLTLTAIPGFHAPMATMIGWSGVLYMAVWMVWQLRASVPLLKRSALLSGIVVAICATCIDLQVDPLATAAGAWVWDSSLPPAFHGVPLVNFIAWLCALWPIGYMIFRIQDERGIDEGGRFHKDAVLKLAALTPYTLVLAALSFMVATALVEGVEGPSWTLLYAFTGKVGTLLLGS